MTCDATGAAIDQVSPVEGISFPPAEVMRRTAAGESPAQDRRARAQSAPRQHGRFAKTTDPLVRVRESEVDGLRVNLQVAMGEVTQLNGHLLKTGARCGELAEALRRSQRAHKWLVLAGVVAGVALGGWWW